MPCSFEFVNHKVAIKSFEVNYITRITWTWLILVLFLMILHQEVMLEGVFLRTEALFYSSRRLLPSEAPSYRQQPRRLILAHGPRWRGFSHSFIVFSLFLFFTWAFSPSRIVQPSANFVYSYANKNSNKKRFVLQKILIMFKLYFSKYFLVLEHLFQIIFLLF